LTAVGVDTSVAIPLVVERHPDHELVARWWAGRPVALVGHALVETYSVLTRLPPDLRVVATVAGRVLSDWFPSRPALSEEAWRRIPETCAGAGITGGAVYDAMIGLAAVEHGLELASRDARAQPTYAAVGARVTLVP